MKVEEMIAILQGCPSDALVSVWDPYHDCASYNVHISHTIKDGVVHIGNVIFGHEHIGLLRN